MTFLALIVVLQFSEFEAINVTIECTFQPLARVWEKIDQTFLVCDVQNENLTSQSIVIEAVGTPGATVPTGVQVFKLTSKKLPLIPSGLKNVFTNLEGIYIDDSDLSFLDDGVMAELGTSLKYLSITNTLLSVIFKDTFSANTDLELLDLSNNAVNYIDGTSFDSLTQLEYLYLEGVLCVMTEPPAETRDAVLELINSVKSNCIDTDLFQAAIGKQIKENLLNIELLENCQNGGDDPTTCDDCQAELDSCNIKYNEQLNVTIERENEIAELNEDILDLNRNITSLGTKIKELEAEIKELEDNSICDNSNGTCRFRDVSGQYTCVANGINIASAKDQNVVWTGTHLTGKTNASVLSLVIQSQSTSLLPLTIGSTFGNLKKLTIKASKLTTIKRGELDTMRKLTTLEITGNNISTIDAGAFDSLLLLDTIDLSENSIVSLPASIFEFVTSLKSVSLNDNALTKVRYDWIGSATTIKMFYLRNNSLVKPIDRNFIYRLRTADVIDLTGTGCDYSFNLITDPNTAFITFYSNIIKNC